MAMASAVQNSERQVFYCGDQWLLISAVLLLAFGLVMMTSASIEIAENRYHDAFFHLKRQLVFMGMGLAAALVVVSSPLAYWRKSAAFLLLAGLVMLVLVLIPGIGREVNGSMRWLNLGFVGIQPSELAKLFVVIFMAWYFSKNQELVRDTWKGFIIPLLLLLPVLALLLKEPDFGATVVLMIAVSGMLFLAGVQLHRLLVLMMAAAAGAAALIVTAPYRLQRLETFIQALADPFNEEVVYGSGYQLAQALIAFGRGEWFGVGLGNSIQKMYFLPEAHTDFVIAIVAEELGFISVLLVLTLFVVFVARAMLIGRKNETREDYFAAYLAYGIAFLFLGQILINVAVNVGLLPTKGLTLPFLSHGGSSLMVTLLMLAILIRIDLENYYSGKQSGSKGRRNGVGT